MEKVAKTYLTKCSKCNIIQVISDLVCALMNFNAFKIIFKKIIKKFIMKDPGLIFTQGNLLVV